MDGAPTSAKDAARSKFKASQRHKPAGPAGRGFAARGRGGGAGRGRSPSPDGDVAGEGNAWRYQSDAGPEADEDSNSAAAAAVAGEPPPPRSCGADLAELLERAAQSSFLGRGGARAAFAPGWGDAGDGDAQPAAAGAAPLTALLDWRAPPVTAALASLPLHALLGLPRRYSAECEAAHARDVARAVAALLAEDDTLPGARDVATTTLPPAAPQPQPKQQPQLHASLPAASASAAAASSIAAPPPPPPKAACDDDDDDAFLDEMLGPG